MRFTRDNKHKHPAGLVAAFDQGRITDIGGRPLTDRAVFDRLPASQMLVTDATKPTAAPVVQAVSDQAAVQERYAARKHTLANAWKGVAK